jgi:ABC-type protease/lipase transport system fused ATPase/permease subunit
VFALGTLSRFTSQPQSHHQVTRKLEHVAGRRVGSIGDDRDAEVSTRVSNQLTTVEVATSTTHDEYIGQYNAIIDLQWLRTFLDGTQLYTGAPASWNT